MDPILVAALSAGGLFFGMLALLEVGRRAGKRRLAEDPEGARRGLGTVEGSIFGLLGLLVAFTFSGASERFDARRHLIRQEANFIGTAWLRIDVVPESHQPALRDAFRSYVDARTAVFAGLPDRDAEKRDLATCNALQSVIWKLAITACDSAQDGRAAMLLLPALNEMFDITTTRLMAAKIHPPPIVHALLCALALTGALLAGYAMAEGKHRSRVHGITFAAIIALTVYVIIDIEYPRAGLVRVDAFDQVIVDLRKSMK
jgi:hypothetical protein